MIPKSKQKDQVEDSEPAEIDFGIRTVSNQNFSKMVALPKQALANCGCGDSVKFNVKLVKGKDESYLKLVPVCETDEEDEGGKDDE